MLVDFLRWVHVIGAAVLLGTGAGIAFFMLMAHRTGKPALIAHTASIVVVADFVFTATAAVVQPLTGYLLAKIVGWPLQGWLGISIALFILGGLCWLPVIWIQIRLRDLARHAASDGTALPPEYHRLFATWCWLGVPAFVAMLAIIWLMLAKPQF